MGQTCHRNLRHPVKSAEDLRINPQPFVADDQHRPADKLEGEKIFRVRRLFEADQLPTFLLEPIEHRGQAAVDLDLDRIGPVAGNPLVKLARTTGNHPPDAKTAAGPYDIGKIDPAAKLRAGEDEFPWGSQLDWRLVAEVFEG